MAGDTRSSASTTNTHSPVHRSTPRFFWALKSASGCVTTWQPNAAQNSGVPSLLSSSTTTISSANRTVSRHSRMFLARSA